MSDFLEFKDEIIDGNAKYFVTDNADGTKNISLANPIIQNGTELNKNKLSIVNNILGYSKTYGSHDDLYNNIYYNSELSQNNDFKDEQIVNIVYEDNTIVNPPKQMEIKNESVVNYLNNISGSYIHKLNNDNYIFINPTEISSSAYYGYGPTMKIINNNGDILYDLEIPSSSTIKNNFYNFIKAIETENNIIVYFRTSTAAQSAIFCSIYSKQGEFIKDISDLLYYDYTKNEIIKLNNNNIVYVCNGYYGIIDENGNDVFPKTLIDSTYVYSPYIFELSNNNVFIANRQTSRVFDVKFIIIGIDGHIIKSLSSTNLSGSETSGGYEFVELSNGNIFGKSLSTSSDYLAKYTFISPNYEIINSGDVGKTHFYYYISENEYIYITGGSSGNNVFYSFDNNGNFVERNITYSSGYGYNLRYVELGNGKVIGLTYYSGNNYYAIFENGSFTKNFTSIGTYYLNHYVKTDNNKIICYSDNSSNNGLVIYDIDNDTFTSNLGGYNSAIDVIKLKDNLYMIYNSYRFKTIDVKSNIVSGDTSLSFDGVIRTNEYIYITQSDSCISVINNNGEVILENNKVRTDSYYFLPIDVIDDSNILVIMGHINSGAPIDRNKNLYIDLIEFKDYGKNQKAYFNNVEVDTIFQSNKYYELLYKSGSMDYPIEIEDFIPTISGSYESDYIPIGFDIHNYSDILNFKYKTISPRNAFLTIRNGNKISCYSKSQYSTDGIIEFDIELPDNIISINVSTYDSNSDYSCYHDLYFYDKNHNLIKEIKDIREPSYPINYGDIYNVKYIHSYYRGYSTSGSCTGILIINSLRIETDDKKWIAKEVRV